MSHLVFVETSGSGVNALDYAKRTGHTVTYLYSSEYDFTATPQQRELAKKLADHTAPLPDRREPEDLLGALREAGVRPGDVDAVLSTLAFCVPAAAALAEFIGARGVPSEAVERARDKGRCRDVLEGAGIASLRYAVTRTLGETLAAAEAIGYPVIVKPVLGVGKATTTITHSPAQVRGHFASLADELRALETGISGHFDDRFIVEELLIGDLFSVEVASDGRSFVPLACTRQKTGRENPVLELGCTVPSGLRADEEHRLGAYAVEVCKALGLNLGVFHVEAILTARGFVLTEANPRIAGGALPETVNAVADRNMFHIFVDLFLGQPLPPAPLTLTGASSHSILAAARAGTVRADLPPDWFDAFRGRIHSGFVDVEPGEQLEAMRGNFDKIGMVRVVAQDAARAQARLAEVTAGIARELGVELAQPGPAGPSHS